MPAQAQAYSQAQAQTIVQDFYSHHPELKGMEKLVALAAQEGGPQFTGYGPLMREVRRAWSVPWTVSGAAISL